MTNPTTPFSWQMPTASDLVTDLPADFETFGQAVATSMADLLGGTTGQILSKASNTDMDFTWITNDVGDITAVTAGTGLSGGGTSGAVTLSIDTATTVDLTTAQTLTNKTLTSPVLTTPTISTINAKGDLLAGTADNTIAALTVGANNTVLTADSSTATGLKWATPASSSPTFVGASAYKTTNQTTSNNTYALITFDAENFDSDGFHSNVTNNSRMTVPSGKAGKYLITGLVGYASNASGVRLVRLNKNGSTFFYFSAAPFSGDTVSVPLNYTIDLAVGDYVELYAYQSAGGTLAIESTDKYTTFQVNYLGA